MESWSAILVKVSPVKISGKADKKAKLLAEAPIDTGAVCTPVNDPVPASVIATLLN